MFNMSDYNFLIRLRANKDSIYDLSENNWTNNNVSTANKSPFSNNMYSLSFNGNSKLIIPTNSNFNLGTNDFTVYWWEYLNNNTTGNPIFNYQDSVYNSSTGYNGGYLYG